MLTGPCTPDQGCCARLDDRKLKGSAKPLEYPRRLVLVVGSERGGSHVAQRADLQKVGVLRSSPGKPKNNSFRGCPGISLSGIMLVMVRGYPQLTSGSEREIPHRTRPARGVPRAVLPGRGRPCQSYTRALPRLLCFYWPLIGWGIHALGVFGFGSGGGPLGRDWEARKTGEMMDEEEGGSGEWGG